MLSIYFGNCPDAIYDTSMYFRNAYQPSWLKDEFAYRVIQAVDKSKVLDGELIDSSVLGYISPFDLSGGVKTLLLIRNLPELIFNASTCGNNCARWILEMARDTDITINLRHIMLFKRKRLKVRVLNDIDSLDLNDSIRKLINDAVDSEGIVRSMNDLALVAGFCLEGNHNDWQA